MTEKEKKEAELQALDDEVATEVLGLQLVGHTFRSYSTYIAAAWDVEEEIQRRGLYAEYGEAMSILLDSPFVSASYYDFLHASPELRCKAALSCVRAAKETP